jgi:Cdc6-like AAA superfamily ATPase
VKYILQQIQENTNAFALYVNCWENKTLNLILDRIAEQLSSVIAEKDYSIKLSRMRQKIKDRPYVVAVDEIDKVDRENLNGILYMLKEIGKVGVVKIDRSIVKFFDYQKPNNQLLLAFSATSKETSILPKVIARAQALSHLWQASKATRKHT